MGLKKRDPVEPELSSELDTALSELRARVHGCPPPDLLQAAQADVLPDEQAKEVKQHAERCSLCKSLLADLESLDEVELDKAGRQRIWAQIKDGMPAETKAPRAYWWWLRPLPMAGAVATLAVLIFGVVLVRDRQRPETPTAENHPPAAVGALPSAFQLEKAPIVLPASAAIVWRGREDLAAKQARELKQALVPYAANNYAEATRRLRALHKKYPRMAEASYYLGISQLFLNDNEQAARSLNDAVKLAQPSLSEQAKWYLALADYRTGKPNLANGLLEPLCSAGGNDSARACAAVKELRERR